MKKILFMLIVTVVTGVGYAMTADSEMIDPVPSKAVAAQVYKMLDVPNIPDEIRGHRAEVRLAVDRGNYLRILTVETENVALKEFIKKNVDFQRLAKGTFEQGVVYRIPIEVKK
ncbi:hypothetical protein D1013_15820 [Euzebyella marina]|uniref:TonB C-terminal domain-containing protein n=1 Tax=Euzebyella marina TaxID=1761453 RepID=A0A3G2L972_9FLAO|nr:hypothetical protein [Euzebyella marina]AYN68741.1 hypothetical protein D1013_15820 [Euzebyella marina]MAU72175.1 hypothetical protein [Pseudozobellia sp.]MBG48731.1 hypothetical protein [Pseudozobellia sp.]|tara:strand:- start:843 stop:1184 length:342 start_codon:yes stop_codon:yes gene_type:complete